MLGVGLLAACPALHGDTPPPLPVIEHATVVGTEACLECHDDVRDGYAGTAHAHVMSTRANACEICHGAGSKHAESLEIDDILGSERLRALEPLQRSTLCLECHPKQAAPFRASAHGDAGVSCWDCHPDALHTRPPADTALPLLAHGWTTTPAEDGTDPLITVGAGPRELRFCIQCHGEVEAEFALQYHHPVPEGTMRCTDCHAVHDAERWGRLEGDDARCFTCHRDVQGPFLFEHYALEDGCASCHSPHGSMVDKLLVQADNGLCEQCHFDANFPLIGAVDHTGLLAGGGRCYDCHFQVHGSNTDENFNPLRIEETLRGGGRP